MASSLFREDSLLWDALIIVALLFMAALVIAVLLDMKDGR